MHFEVNFSLMSIILTTIVSQTDGSLNDSRALLKGLMADYDKNVRPVSDVNATVNVSVKTFLKSIQFFDELREIFIYTAAFHLVWQDDGMVWNPASHGGVEDVWVSSAQVWIPEIILTTPSDEMTSFAKEWQMVKYNEHGRATMTTGGLVQSTCSVDIGKYPFDKQVCKSDFEAWSYTETEVRFLATSPTIDLSLYSENVAWALDGASVQTTVQNGVSQLVIEMSLQRKAEFIVVNIVLPILFLSVINIFVFFLVPESGERISYCITVLLSIAVFMTIISDTLPKSSSPLPWISYKLMVDMIISSLVTLVTIFNLQLYYKDDTVLVPTWVKSLYHMIYCTKTAGKMGEMKNIKVKKNKVDKVMILSDVEDSSDSGNTKDPLGNKETAFEFTKEMAKESDTEKESSVDDITWKDVSRMVDTVACVFFMFLSMLNFSIFMVYVNA